MNQFLSSNAQVTFSRYFRLMALACMDTLLTIPFASFAIWINTTQYGGPAPWRGWADAKWGFSRVGTFPAIFWQSDKYGKMSFAMSRAFIVVCAVVFFAFFGFAEEARKNYRRVFWGVARKFGYSMPIRGTTMGTSKYVLLSPAFYALSFRCLLYFSVSAHPTSAACPLSTPPVLAATLLASTSPPRPRPKSATPSSPQSATSRLPSPSTTATPSMRSTTRNATRSCRLRVRR